VLAPDEASVTAFGVNPLDPAVRAPSAWAGATQGHRSAPHLADLWLE
jgi:NTE family protein